MELDIRPQNSWNPVTDNPDDEAAYSKRLQLWFWQLLPLDPLL